jgi:GAF domain
VPTTPDPRLFDLLDEMNRELVEHLPADASSVSRVIGDLILLVSECPPEGQTLQMGQGYLMPDYPATKSVLTTGTPYAMTLEDVDADPAEARVLEELGFASLLLARLDLGGTASWGLVEVYRTEPVPFEADAIRVAGEILARTTARAG